MAGNVHEITDATFDKEVLKATGVVLVDFWAPWCGPCKMIAPSLEEISTEMVDKVKITKVNVDDNQTSASRYGIRSIPTLLLFKNGELAATKVGGASKNDLTKWITSAL